MLLAYAKNDSEEMVMKIAVTYENGEVFQHFGHTEQFKLYEVSGGKLLHTQVVDTNGSGHVAIQRNVIFSFQKKKNLWNYLKNFVELKKENKE